VAYFETKRVRVTGRDDVPGYGSAGDDAGSYPALVEFLTRDRYQDNSIRERGTVLLFVEGGRLKACLNDKDAALVGFTTIDTLDDVSMALDKALREDKVDWRKQRGQRGDQNGRRAP
jgi:hypothetical protein